MSSDTMQRLVAAAAGGDGEAAEAVFAQAAKLAYARAFRLTGDADSAWDVAQDALASAIRGLPKLREPASFLWWLRAIVDRAATAHRGRVSRRREDPLSSTAELHSPDRGPAAAAEQGALAEQARRAMERLPARERVIVELFYFEEMSCREVAEFLNTTRDAVKTALHRSRAQMRREVTRMTTASGKKTAERPIGRTMSGGDSRAEREDLLFEHDSRTARFYVELYPSGEAEKAARALGMDKKAMGSELAWLEARKMIAREGELWRCTMPLLNEKDGEIIRPWAEEVTAPVTGALEGLYGRLSAIAEEIASGSARDTVIAAGLYAEVAMRPFNVIAEAVKTSPVDRGEFGKRNVAAVSAEVEWPMGYGGGIDSGEWRSNEFAEVRRHYFLWPTGTDRSDLVRFAEKLGEDAMHPVPGQGLVGFLCSLGCDPVGVEGVGERAGEFGLNVVNAEAFLADLERLHAITRRNGSVELAMPVVAHAVWQPFLDELDRVGERIVAAAADAAEDLRQRMVRCSFAECEFSDSVGLCLRLAQGLVGDAIGKRGWVEFPKRADFSWGMMFVW